MNTVKVNNGLALAVLKIIISSVVIGISIYWAHWVTQGAQKASINEVMICQMTENLNAMKSDMKEDLNEIKRILDILYRGEK